MKKLILLGLLTTLGLADISGVKFEILSEENIENGIFESRYKIQVVCVNDIAFLTRTRDPGTRTASSTSYPIYTEGKRTTCTYLKEQNGNY